MFDLARFSLKEMTECGAALRKLGEGASSLEDVGNRVVQYLYANLGDRRTEERACVLIRLFKTHPYMGLDPELQRFAAGRLERQPDHTMKCFTLIATAGYEPEWNVRAQSKQFKAIPIEGERFVAQFPMFSQLMVQFGLDLHTLLKPGSELLLDRQEHTFNVFYVPEATGSRYIPCQKEFVVPYGVQSVLGFGSILPSGELFAVILFAKVHIARGTADLFKTLALCTKIALLPFENQAVFAG